jgi:hypothetical protein
MRLTQPVMTTGGPICPGGGISFVTTRGVAPVPALGGVVGVVVVPGDGSEGFVGVLGDGVAVVGGIGVAGVGAVGCPGVIAGGAGGGAPGWAGGVAGCAGAGGCAKSSVDASVTVRRAVTAITNGRGEIGEVMVR